MTNEDATRQSFDLGHQLDVDRTQIAAMLRLTPTERLARLAKMIEFINRATPQHVKLLRKRHSEAGPKQG